MSRVLRGVYLRDGKRTGGPRRGRLARGANENLGKEESTEVDGGEGEEEFV